MKRRLQGNVIKFVADNKTEQNAIRKTFNELASSTDPRSGKERFGKLFDMKLVDEKGLVTALKIVLDKSDVSSPVERSQHIKEIFAILDKNLGRKMY